MESVVGTPDTSSIVSILEGCAFGLELAEVRARGFAPYEPWPEAVGEPGPRAGADPLVSFLHGQPSGIGSVPSTVLRQLQEAGLAASGADLRPGRWEVTAFEGVVAARDRALPPRHSEVYLGEDGLRFVDFIRRVRPTGRVLEVGCGSGIVSAALAQSCEAVLAIDVVPTCVEATRLTAQLNGVADRVRAVEGDLLSADYSKEFDCVAANLPGVPVPPGVTYSPAGNGGRDGLSLIRALLDRVPGWLTAGAGRAAAPVLLMRFQSMGDASLPLLARELVKYAGENSFDIEIHCDSRVPVEVRSALTAHYAAPLNDGLSAKDIMAIADRHATELAATCYYSCNLVARRGSGQVRFTATAVPNWLDVPVRGSNPHRLDDVEYRYYGRLRTLPDGYWELGNRSLACLPLQHLTELRDVLLSEPGTLRSAIHRVFGRHFTEQPLQARSLYTSGGLLIDTLVELGVLEENNERVGSAIHA